MHETPFFPPSQGRRVLGFGGKMADHNDQPQLFATTHWTLVLEAGDARSERSNQALEELCGAYWFPLYAYARRLGQDEETAKDSTQGFFAKLLEKNYLGIADRRRGRFRWFMLTAFKGFMANEWDRQKAVKRGGGATLVSLDQISAEERYHLEPAHHESPDRVYEKRWALTLIGAARERLRDEFESAGKLERFAALEPHLTGDGRIGAYAELAADFGTTPDAIKQSVHRMKQRYRELVREEVAKTVAWPDEVDDEIVYLMDVLGK